MALAKSSKTALGARAFAAEHFQLQVEVEQFYFAEAAALDERRYQDWLRLFSDDAHYWMPIRRTTTAADRETEFSQAGSVALFDDDKQMLAARVAKLGSGSSWSEEPPSRTRHLITNVRILSIEENRLRVASNFHLYRARFDAEEDNWIGRRDDVLERMGDAPRIKTREIYLDQTLVLARNLSVLF